MPVWHDRAILDSFQNAENTANVPSDVGFQQLLRGASLRVTAPRVAVLSVVHEHPHAETDAIVRAVRARLAAVSRQAVYDSLHTLTEAGLLRRIQPRGLLARYETRVGDNHHHLVCRACGAIADVDCQVGAAPCLTAADDHGFVIDEAEILYWGLCAECAATHHDPARSPLDPFRKE